MKTQLSLTQSFLAEIKSQERIALQTERIRSKHRREQPEHIKKSKFLITRIRLSTAGQCQKQILQGIMHATKILYDLWKSKRNSNQ